VRIDAAFSYGQEQIQGKGIGAPIPKDLHNLTKMFLIEIIEEESRKREKGKKDR